MSSMSIDERGAASAPLACPPAPTTASASAVAPMYAPAVPATLGGLAAGARLLAACAAERTGRGRDVDAVNRRGAGHLTSSQLPGLCVEQPAKLALEIVTSFVPTHPGTTARRPPA